MTTSEEFRQFLIAEGYTDIRFLDETVYICLSPFIFTWAIIIGQIGDTTGYADLWCYHNYADAKSAIDSWNGEGEPQGWHRNPRTGRRRTPDGAEYVRH